MEREVAKFLGLIKGGVYVNSLEDRYPRFHVTALTRRRDAV